MKLYLISIFSVLLLMTCQAKGPVIGSARDLGAYLETGMRSSMYRGTYYCGTKKSFHYVLYTKEASRDVMIKVPLGALDIKKIRPYPLPKKERIDISKWHYDKEEDKVKRVGISKKL